MTHKQAFLENRLVNRALSAGRLEQMITKRAMVRGMDPRELLKRFDPNADAFDETRCFELLEFFP